jgi:hypothetical protein
MLNVLLILTLSQNPANAKDVIYCDVPPSKYQSKNLRDLDLLTKFMRMRTLYPWFQYHCNGVSCTEEEYEGFCYELKKALDRGEDPNMVMIRKLN